VDYSFDFNIPIEAVKFPAFKTPEGSGGTLQPPDPAINVITIGHSVLPGGRTHRVWRPPRMHADCFAEVRRLGAGGDDSRHEQRPELVLQEELRPTVPRDRFTLNNSVVLTGAVVEGTQILLNPTMKLEVVRTSPVASGLSITNLRFVRSQALTGGGYRHYFTGDLVSQDVEAPMGAATVSSENDDVNFAQAGLTFLAVQAGATSTTPTTISVDTDSETAPSTTGWLWSFEATGIPVTVPIQDGGSEDGVPGDGLFTGVFTAAQTGQYSAVLTATGTSPSGAEYKRIASTTFRVAAESGAVLACSDQPWDDDGNGHYDRLQTTMQVHVAQESSYRVHLNLADAEGHQVASDAYLWLTAGGQDVALGFPAIALRRTFTSNGPYQRVNAQLLLLDGYREEVLATSQCGSTQAYQLADFEPEPIHLTGSPALVPVNQNGIPGYERLELSQPLTAPDGTCSWYAVLAAADATRLDSVNGQGVWSGGSGTLTASFSGPKIYRSGKSGPYQVSSLDVSCAGYNLHKANAAQSAQYAAADFENTPADFTLSTLNISAQPGVRATTQVTSAASGGFEGEIALAVVNLPVGWTAALQSPTVAAGGSVSVDIAPSSSATEGTYAVTVTGTSGSLAHTASPSVTITATSVEDPSQHASMTVTLLP
jgi:hypothetical protein